MGDFLWIALGKRENALGKRENALGFLVYRTARAELKNKIKTSKKKERVRVYAVFVSIEVHVT